MRLDFIKAVKANQPAFGLYLPDDAIERLADFYVLVQERNPLLHLVAPITAEEFAVRHVLESLTLLEHLPKESRFADVGTGAGLPSIPCLLVRKDISALLIESKIKKAEYLTEAAGVLGIAGRVRVENRQFEEVTDTGFSAVTCRALDKFTEKLPRLVKWSRGRPLLLFGGPTLEEALNREKIRFSAQLMPMSDRRYLYVTEKLSAVGRSRVRK
jgi:16S rRNA (guanine(527)-N(7))-methyltransferase RsmG